MNKNKYFYDESENNKWDKFEKEEFRFNVFNIIDKTSFFLIVFFISMLLISVTAANSQSVDDLPVVVQELVPPPFVPEHDQISIDGPKIVKVTMVVDEKIIEIDQDGTQFRVFAFNDSIPGPLIVVHEGDYIELTLKNPEENIVKPTLLIQPGPWVWTNIWKECRPPIASQRR